jgi:flagellar basal-body rod modification protein FlgD
MDTQGVGIEAVFSSPPSSNNSATALGGDDFFKLLIAQLTNQDPLEPTSNEELLKQISSIREIELSTKLTESLSSLTGQQRFGAASSLIGKFVIGQAQGGEVPVSGVVSGVRFDPNGDAILQLESGGELPLEKLRSVMNPEGAAGQFIDQYVVGVDTSRANDPRVVEGVVVSSRTEDNGRVMLDLDTGEELALANVVETRRTDAATEDREAE